VEFIDTLQAIASFTLHIDHHLLEFFNQHGTWIFALLFLIVFCETGLVVTPFLPGDSLLFAVGALAASSALNVHTLAFTVLVAYSVRGCSATLIQNCFGATTSNALRRSTQNTAARPSSSRVSFQSFAASHPSSPA